jgi:hypothetical protein
MSNIDCSSINRWLPQFDSGPVKVVIVRLEWQQYPGRDLEEKKKGAEHKNAKILSRKSTQLIMICSGFSNMIRQSTFAFPYLQPYPE